MNGLQSKQFIIVTVALVAAAGWALTGAANSAFAQTGDVSAFGGTWNCPGRGTLTLTQAGSGVTGTFTWNGGGSVSGRIVGNTVYVDARESRGVLSTWTMGVSADGTRIDGTWQIPNGPGGAWGCTRAPGSGQQGVGGAGAFGGTWNCPGRGTLTLTQAGSGVTGTFTWNGGGSVSGRIVGNTVYVDARESRGVLSTWTMGVSADGTRIDGTWQIPNGPGGAWGCTRAPGSGQRGPGGCRAVGVTCPGPGGVGLCADPGVLAIMDEWLDRATPPMGPGESLCYDCWGRVLGTARTGAITTGQNPDTGGKTRCEWLYYLAPGLESGNGFGTLASYLGSRGVPR